MNKIMESLLFDTVVRRLSTCGIQVYNSDGTARPADQVLQELISAYADGKLDLTI